MFDYQLFLSHVATKPGVYRMLGVNRKVLYIGKAKNLKNRIASYFTTHYAHSKTRALVKQIVDIELIITNSEHEALILENALIKKYQPHYNILFRDDKSYPYIYLSSHNYYPRLCFYRGRKKKIGQFFGPYSSPLVVRQTLNLLYKLFKIRSCKDSFFKHRSRPCLEYQINRCKAPCVGYVSKKRYLDDVQHAVMLLQGKSHAVIDTLTKQMTKAAASQHYELAASYRNQINAIRALQSSQHVLTDLGDVDVIVAIKQSYMVCVQLLIIRSGQLIDKKNFFPKTSCQTIITIDNIISSFIAYYYFNNPLKFPKKIVLSQRLSEQDCLAVVLSQRAGHLVNIVTSSRGEKAKLLKMAKLNAKEALMMHLSKRKNFQNQLQAMQALLMLRKCPKRIECFDVSHTQGEATVASCVVFGIEGAIKKEYRRFNVSGVKAGDDPAALRQALLYRYTKIKKQGGIYPDLLIVDGGKMQLLQAQQVFEQLKLCDTVILAIAKGKTRKRGFETLFLSNGKQVHFSDDNIGMHLLQNIRDQAHQFAITSHRKKRERARNVSPITQIIGVGSKRCQLLLTHFGGLQGVKKASIEDLLKVNGINQILAQKIYDHVNQ